MTACRLTSDCLLANIQVCFQLQKNRLVEWPSCWSPCPQCYLQRGQCSKIKHENNRITSIGCCTLVTKHSLLPIRRSCSFAFQHTNGKLIHLKKNLKKDCLRWNKESQDLTHFFISNVLQLYSLMYSPDTEVPLWIQTYLLSSCLTQSFH